MAQTRLEKIGTIYSRLLGLYKSGAAKYENRPIWFDVYECRDKTNEKSAADHLVSGVPSISGWQRPRQQTAGSEQLNIKHSAQIQVQSKVH